MPATYIDVDIYTEPEEEENAQDAEALRFVRNHDDETVADLWYALSLEAKEMESNRAKASNSKMRAALTSALEEIAEKFQSLEVAIREEHRYNRVVQAARKIAAHNPPPEKEAPASTQRNNKKMVQPRYSPSHLRSTSSRTTSTSSVAAETKLRFTESNPQEFTRVWEYDPPFTSGVSRMAAESSNADRFNFRDSHHGPGIRRSMTKGIWFAVVIGLEALVLFFSRRILAGDVPFDFIRRAEHDNGPSSVYAPWVNDDEEETRVSA